MNMTDTPLSESEIQLFNNNVGRKISKSQLVPTFVRQMNSMENEEKRRAKQYTRRVWSEISLTQYLSDETKKCADFAFDRFINGTRSIGKTYLLKNPHGARYRDLGVVHFRVPDQDLLDKFSENALLKLTPYLAIERIDLHPSIQRQGFMSSLIAELKIRNFKMVVLQCIVNPSLAFHFHNKSLEPESNVILLSDQNTIQFESTISPSPSFGLLLE